MKIICGIGAICIILFAGCSSTYRVNDFPTKEKFYDEFNNSFKAKEVNVTLTNDSSFSIYNGAWVENDTLFSLVNLEGKRSRSLALEDVADIKYSGTDITYTLILLQNGDELKTENFRRIADSIYFEETIEYSKSPITPISCLKKVSYKNRWIGTLTGVPAGFVACGALGYTFGKTTADNTDPGIMTDQYHKTQSEQRMENFVSGAFVGLIVGGIGGYFFGYPITYEFNK
ncbi:MAG: hypothetical protein M0P61_06660 [Ignavibacteriaceae bacterium]|jgi:hypothetical protein|nr:hypothetical protein [Ignavibacteriaceae bacterium]